VNRLALIGLLAFLSGCVLEEDGPDVWASGGAVTAGGGAESEPTSTACRLALDESVVALVGGRVDCAAPYYAVCVSGEFEDMAAGAVCCDGEEPGSDCVVHDAEWTPLGPAVEPCADGYVHVCDF
jgi:hypothetical protein